MLLVSTDVYILCTMYLRTTLPGLHTYSVILWYKRETMKNNVTLFGLLLLSKEHP